MPQNFEILPCPYCKKRQIFRMVRQNVLRCARCGQYLSFPTHIEFKGAANDN